MGQWGEPEGGAPRSPLGPGRIRLGRSDQRSSGAAGGRSSELDQQPPVAGRNPPYIAFEGAEGSGKSTQAALLAESLGAVLTQETGGTAIGQRLRAILHDNDVVELEPRAEALIAAADRAQHLSEIVIPALRAGRTVVSDRSVYSTLAYQGYGRELDLDDLRRINDWAVQGVWPSLVVFVEAPPDVVADRLNGRELDRFERAGDEFHRRVLHGFRSMAAADPDRWIVVAADGTREAIAAEILDAVHERLGGIRADD